MTKLILVNANDEPVGISEKLEAHQKGLLHRAFSLFVYRLNPNQEIEILLQQRNPKKYHSGGLWTNTCCSHPSPNETLEDAVIRRTKEELNIPIEKEQLQKTGVFHYTAKVGNDLIENEIDHVFVAKFSYADTTGPTFQLQLDPNEISQINWVTLESLKNNLHHHPESYTAWFNQALGIAEKSFFFSVHDKNL